MQLRNLCRAVKYAQIRPAVACASSLATWQRAGAPPGAPAWRPPVSAIRALLHLEKLAAVWALDRRHAFGGELAVLCQILGPVLKDVLVFECHLAGASDVVLTSCRQALDSYVRIKTRHLYTGPASQWTPSSGYNPSIPAAAS